MVGSRPAEAAAAGATEHTVQREAAALAVSACWEWPGGQGAVQSHPHGERDLVLVWRARVRCAAVHAPFSSHTQVSAGDLARVNLTVAQPPASSTHVKYTPALHRLLDGDDLDRLSRCPLSSHPVPESAPEADHPPAHPSARSLIVHAHVKALHGTDDIHLALAATPTAPSIHRPRDAQNHRH